MRKYLPKNIAVGFILAYIVGWMIADLINERDPLESLPWLLLGAAGFVLVRAVGVMIIERVKARAK